jgi:PAS domain S-box-containing protein
LADDAKTARLLLDAARQLGETLDPDRLYDTFHDLLSGSVGHDGIVVSSYDPAEGLIRCDYAWVGGTRLDPASFPPLPLNRHGEGMQSRVIMTGETLLTNDVAGVVSSGRGTYYDVDASGTFRKLPDEGAPRTRAAMMVPVKHEGAVVGVVQIMSDRQTYEPEEVALVEGLVGLTGAAVRNARLAAAQRRLEAAEAAARAAAQEREQAARVLAAVGEGIALVDDRGCVRLWNPAAERILGIAAEDIVDRQLEEVVPGWRIAAERLGADGETATRETLPVAVGDRELWLSIVAVRSPDGTVYAFRDETSERALDHARNTFIATVSHELRTPLAGIYGAAVTLQRREFSIDTEQRNRLLAIVAGETQRLARIVDEILLAAQLESGRMVVAHDSIDLRATAEDVLSSARERLDSHTLLLDAPEALPPVVADEQKLRQVLANLVDNAIKYAPSGTHVHVSLEAERDRVVARVRDEGPGIPAADRGRIFEKFFRLDPDHVSGVAGTGLGLYIARGLVERMDGEIWVEPEERPGATFAVSLRAALPA